MTGDLFSNANLARTAAISTAPMLDAKPNVAWPYSSMTAEHQVRNCIVMSTEYANMLEAVIRSQGDSELTSSQIRALIPQDWRDLMGRWLCAGLCARMAEQSSIAVKYVSHDVEGFHFTYWMV